MGIKKKSGLYVSHVWELLITALLVWAPVFHYQLPKSVCFAVYMDMIFQGTHLKVKISRELIKNQTQKI